MRTRINAALIAMMMALAACGGGGGGGSTSASTNIDGPTSINRGGIGTFTAYTTASLSAEFEWAMLAQPAGSLPVTDSVNDQVVIPANQSGDYTLQVVITDGESITTASHQYSVVEAGRQPSREAAPSEIDRMFSFSYDAYIEARLRSPASFALVSEPSFTIGSPDTEIGVLRIEFDSANGFGTLLRNTVLCGYEWSGFSWGVLLGPDLEFCGFL